MVGEWRNSLYARAALFLVLGCGSVLGAVVVLSSALVEESVERLLEERMDFALTTGVLFEQLLSSDLAHMSREMQPLLARAADDPELVKALEEHRGPLFDRGAFLLDERGRTLGRAGGEVLRDPGRLYTRLVEESRTLGRPVVSSLRGQDGGGAPFLVLIGPLLDERGRIAGFVGGLLQPAETRMVNALVQARGGSQTELDVVDQEGVVVASTQRARLYRHTDHRRVLTEAMRTRRPLRGRCHSCHESGPAPSPRGTDVLAFAALPSLALGVAVHEPESSALAPALELRGRISLLGGVFGSLFLLFAGLSVRSVVRPINRLTRHVRRLEAAGTRQSLPALGRDEVGELAHALDRWRGRMFDLLDEVEQKRMALRDEVGAVRRHLEALQEIAFHGTVDTGVDDIAREGLERIVAVLDLEVGTLAIRCGDQLATASEGLAASHAAALLARVEGEPRGMLDLRTNDGEGRELGTLVGASVSTARGIVVACVVGHAAARSVEERWLISLLLHVGMSAANRLLREREVERRQLNEQLLHRVLTAQEDERRRIARELHDTLAQDLSALRLELERLSNRAGEPGMAGTVGALEQRTHNIIVMLRRILLDLRLTVLERHALVPTMQAHLDRIEQAHGVRGVLTVHGDEPELRYEVAVMLFRIFQEALQNVVQHAGAEHAFVTIGFKAGEVSLEVEDDGKGFRPDDRTHRPDGDGRGLGLLGLEERARLLGGRFELDTAPGEGTTVRVAVPTEVT